MTEYTNRILFLRKSKKGEHLYAFQRDGILGGETESLVMNVSDVKQLIDGKQTWCKVSAMEKVAKGRQTEGDTF